MLKFVNLSMRSVIRKVRKLIHKECHPKSYQWRKIPNVAVSSPHSLILGQFLLPCTHFVTLHAYIVNCCVYVTIYDSRFLGPERLFCVFLCPFCCAGCPHKVQNQLTNGNVIYQCYLILAKVVCVIGKTLHKYCSLGRLCNRKNIA